MIPRQSHNNRPTLNTTKSHYDRLTTQHDQTLSELKEQQKSSLKDIDHLSGFIASSEHSLNNSRATTSELSPESLHDLKVREDKVTDLKLLKQSLIDQHGRLQRAMEDTKAVNED
ncbi:hypothetical protein WICPIJ_003481 [Wickerhamomyces pijperi]|uniref:Uncharacterized protein n=1 Tax=Wickerhamomyces pijperi TaxID=599730 RepID=A0A9P8Q9S2_WICPI|nr:hypothetical protein WICPIJ_003481 [Wickerhamomyces pijperi]